MFDLSLSSMRYITLIVKSFFEHEVTSVLMAGNSNRFSLKNAGYGLALVTLPVISPVPIQEVQLLDYAVAHRTVNAGYGLTASAEGTYTGLLDKDPYTSDQQRERDHYELDENNWN